MNYRGDDLAVVTGVLGRLGPIWTDALLGAGARVIGVDLHGEVSADLAEVLARHDSERFHLMTGDVTDRASLSDCLARCVAEAGEPTILVNNAGIDQPPTANTGSWEFGDIPDEVSAAVLDVNTLGVLRVSQVFGARMARRGRGCIANIGSLYAGVAPNQGYYDHIPIDPPFLKPPAYVISKAGVGALTRYLAALWGPRGVRVNTLSPGGVLGGQDPQFLTKFTARVPLGRMAEAADLAGPLLFLTSDLGRYVTGQELLVDGGYTCW